MADKFIITSNEKDDEKLWEQLQLRTLQNTAV